MKRKAANRRKKAVLPACERCGETVEYRRGRPSTVCRTCRVASGEDRVEVPCVRCGKPRLLVQETLKNSKQVCRWCAAVETADKRRVAREATRRESPCVACGKMVAVYGQQGRQTCGATWCRGQQRRLRKYGITSRGQLQAMFDAQGGRCAACRRPGTLDPHPSQRSSRAEARAAWWDRSRLPLVIDHDHATGVVRGLLCSSCNSSIGLLDDSPERIEALLKYVKRHGQLVLSAARTA